MPRPCGTWATPARTISRGPDRVSSLPSSIDRAAGRHHLADRPQRRRLAGAVGAEDHDDLAALDRRSRRRGAPRSAPYRAVSPRDLEQRSVGRHLLPQVGLDDLRVLGHLLRRALGDLAPEVEHDDLVRDPHHHRHVVLDEQDREPVVVADLLDQLAELVDLGVGQAAGRLVEHQQLRRRRPGPGRSRPASACRTAARPPAGTRPRRARGAAAARSTRTAVSPLLAAGPEAQRRRDEVGLRAGVGADHHVLEHGQAGPQREVLERPEDAELGDLVRTGPQEVLALEGRSGRSSGRRSG